MLRTKASSFFVATKGQAELARTVGCHRSYINQVVNGEQVVSLKAARNIGKAREVSPGSLYVLSVLKTLRRASQTHPEELTPGAVVKAIGAAIKGVQELDATGDVNRGDPEFRQAMATLRSMAVEAIEEDEAGEAATKGKTENAAAFLEDHRENGPPHKVERDPFGRSMAVRKNQDAPERDLFGKATKSGSKVERDAHGRRVRD